MERKLLLLSVLVLFCGLVVSDLQPAEWSLLQIPPNVNYVNSQPTYFTTVGLPEIQSGQWPIGQTVSQNQHNLNFENVAPSLYREQPVQLPLRQVYPQRYNNNNFARFQQSSVYKSPQSSTGISHEIIPNDKRITEKQEKSGYQAVNAGTSDILWSSPGLSHQQGETLEGSHNPNILVNNYPQPYVDQQRRNYANYGFESQQFQNPDLTIPNPSGSFHDYRQGWQTQNQYNPVSIPSPMGYIPWTSTGYQNTPPMDVQYIEPNIHNKYNRPANPAIAPVEILYQDPLSNPPVPLYQNDKIRSVQSQLPVNDQSTSPNEGYIIIHPNKTYEQVDNLNDIVVDDLNIAHIITKEVPNHLLAIIKIEDEVKENEFEKLFEIPYDTGISKIPQDASWSTNHQDYLGTPKSYKYSGTLPPVPDTEITSENTEMNYFKPEYIMPIQFDSINNTPDTSLATRQYDENIDETINNVNLHTQQTADIPKRTQSFNDGELLSPFNADVIKITFVEPSEEGFNYNNPIRYGHQAMAMEVMPAVTKEIVVKTNSKTATLGPGDDLKMNLIDDPVSVLQSKFSDGVQGATTTYARDHTVQNILTPTQNPHTNKPTTHESGKLRNNLELGHGETITPPVTDDNVRYVKTSNQNAGIDRPKISEYGKQRNDLKIGHGKTITHPARDGNVRYVKTSNQNAGIDRPKIPEYGKQRNDLKIGHGKTITHPVREDNVRYVKTSTQNAGIDRPKIPEYGKQRNDLKIGHGETITPPVTDDNDRYVKTSNQNAGIDRPKISEYGKQRNDLKIGHGKTITHPAKDGNVRYVKTSTQNAGIDRPNIPEFGKQKNDLKIGHGETITHPVTDGNVRYVKTSNQNAGIDRPNIPEFGKQKNDLKIGHGKTITHPARDGNVRYVKTSTQNAGIDRPNIPEFGKQRNDLKIGHSKTITHPARDDNVRYVKTSNQNAGIDRPNIPEYGKQRNDLKSESGTGATTTVHHPASDDDKTQEFITSTQHSGQAPDSSKLRSDLQIDVSNLKTIVNKPLVWFRPDEQFWEKVTKGEEAFDAVSFYNVQCQPILVERHTTVHHYQNGTAIEEYIETVWNSPGDTNPKVFKSNKIVRNPSRKTSKAEQNSHP